MMEDLEKALGYQFKNREILHTALTHKSYYEGTQQGTVNNEKLEFLGDSVINLVVTEHLFRHMKHMNEGELSKLKAHMVSSEFLFDIARSMGLENHVLLGKGEEKNNGRSNKKIIASLLEAVVGAVFLDSNLKAAAATIVPHINGFFKNIEERQVKVNDYKSELQEIVQKHRNILPVYEIVEESGKSPNMSFTAAVFLESDEMARGSGKSKRQAEQDAARNALKKIDELFDYKKLSEVFFLKND